MHQICCGLRFTYLQMLNQSRCFFILLFYLLIAFAFLSVFLLCRCHLTTFLLLFPMLYGYVSQCCMKQSMYVCLVFHHHHQHHFRFLGALSTTNISLQSPPINFIYFFPSSFLFFFFLFSSLCSSSFHIFLFFVCFFSIRFSTFSECSDSRSTPFDCWLFDFTSWKWI